MHVCSTCHEPSFYCCHSTLVCNRSLVHAHNLALNFRALAASSPSAHPKPVGFCAEYPLIRRIQSQLQRGRRRKLRRLLLPSRLRRLGTRGQHRLPEVRLRLLRTRKLSSVLQVPRRILHQDDRSVTFLVTNRCIALLFLVFRSCFEQICLSV